MPSAKSLKLLILAQTLSAGALIETFSRTDKLSALLIPPLLAQALKIIAAAIIAILIKSLIAPFQMNDDNILYRSVFFISDIS